MGRSKVAYEPLAPDLPRILFNPKTAFFHDLANRAVVGDGLQPLVEIRDFFFVTGFRP